MITDLANLGPSRMGTTDLGVSKAKDIGKAAQTGKPEKASSFDQILQNKVSAKPTENILKADKDVKANQLKKDPVPVQKGMEEMAPTKVPQQKDRVEASSGKDAPRTARKENENWDEPGSVKEEGQSEKVGNKSNSSSANRDQVMLEFMDSMESEFGIPPQRLVEAMTQIPTSDQLSSPEDSASQVIAQLNLPEDEEQKALALYVGMLTQLKQPTPEPMAKAPFLAAAAVTAPAVMTAQEKRALLNQSLDNMNNQFFRKAPMAAKPEMPAGSEFAQTQSDAATRLGLDGLPQDKVQMGKSAMPENLQSLQSQLQANPAIPPQALKEMQAVDPNSAEGQQILKSLATLSAAASALDQEIKADPRTAQALKAEQALKGASTETGAAAATAAGLAALGFGSDEDEGDEMNGDSSPKDPFMVQQGQTHHADLSRKELGETAKQSFGAMMAAAGAEGKNPADNPANVQALMKQAQYLIKKGGGEVKIQMAPEGIGQVHMKMVVNEGKVNLEMSAETKEAKKLIESSMSDLKASLGQHHLTVEKVKVDVGNQLASDQQNSDAGQRQMDQGRDQAKDQTRQFWSEFSQNGGFDRRGTFFESPGVKAYGGNSRQGPALTPTSPGMMGENRYEGSGKGRGLNLVA